MRTSSLRLRHSPQYRLLPVKISWFTLIYVKYRLDTSYFICDLRNDERIKPWPPCQAPGSRKADYISEIIFIFPQYRSMPARYPSLQWYDEWNQNDFSCDETWRNDVTVCWKSANLPKLISYRSGTSMTLSQYSIPNVHTCGEFQSRPCGECVLAV